MAPHPEVPAALAGAWLLLSPRKGPRDRTDGSTWGDAALRGSEGESLAGRGFSSAKGSAASLLRRIRGSPPTERAGAVPVLPLRRRKGKLKPPALARWDTSALLAAAPPGCNGVLQLPAFPYKRAKPRLGLPGKPRWEVSKRSSSADPPGSLGTPALRLLLKCINYQELIDPGCLPCTPQSRERFGCQVPALLPSDASGHPATPIPSGYGAGHRWVLSTPSRQGCGLPARHGACSQPACPQHLGRAHSS